MEQEDKIKIEEASVNLDYLKKELENEQRNNVNSLIGFLDSDAIIKTEGVELYQLELIQCDYCKVCFEEWEHLEDHKLHCLDKNNIRLYDNKLDDQRKPADKIEETQGNGEISIPIDNNKGYLTLTKAIDYRYADGISKKCKGSFNEKKHKCSECSCQSNHKILPQLLTLNRHSNAAEKDIQPFKCDICKRRFNREDTLKLHITNIHSNINEKKYKCSECSYETNHKGSLNTHLNTHNGKSFECDICKKRFTLKSSLRMHMNIHSNTNEKKYKCPKCSYQTYRKGNLKTHLNIHDNNKPFECDICKKKFTDKSSLNRHIKNVHSNTNENKYKCTECSYQTNQKAHLKRHLKTHYNNKPLSHYL